jgi:hypothetical protein
MTAAIAFIPNFPHATIEGYALGCVGNICPGKHQYGWSCADARTRYNGDYQWRMWVLAGMTPLELMQQLAGEREDAKIRARSAAIAERAKARKQAARDKARAEALAHPERASKSRSNNPLGRPRMPSEHGTPRSWYQGCRTDAECPATPTCRQAHVTRKAVTDAIRKGRA